MQGPWKGREDQKRGVYIRVVMHRKWWGEPEIYEWMGDLAQPTSDNGAPLASKGREASREGSAPSRGETGGKS